MFISNVVVRSVVAEVEGRGLRCDRLLRAANLERDTLQRAAGGVRTREFERLLRQALELTGDPALGLAIGTRAPETMLHVLGMLLVTSPTIRDAYRLLTRYGGLVVADLHWQLSERGRLACVGYACPASDAYDEDRRRFSADCALALALRIVRHFAPSEPLHEVWFQHTEPGYAEQYAQLFGCPVRFRQQSNALLFKRSLLDRAQPHADAMLSTALLKIADDLREEAEGESSFSARVRAALRYESDLAKVDLEQLARRWGMSGRALRRRLRGEGRSFTELLEEARCQRAFAELRKPACKIREVAEDLGYSETSAFHRAFKRWTGRTPSDYKAALQASA